MYTKVALLSLYLVGCANADLRMATRPRNGYNYVNQGNVRWAKGADVFARYMIPSVFRYKGLKYPGGQKYNNYDNFLRSNIDNEQDNRNFNDERGEDHLPFRTLATKVDVTFRTNRYDGAVRGSDLRKTIQPGGSLIVPLRWNNPHAAEIEVNIWIFQHAGKHPVAIPIRKPVCSGEGHQDFAVSFTVPKDFAQLGSKIPGFKGCNDYPKTNPMCTVQIYAHSVESRQYAMAFPVIITGHDASVSTSSSASIQNVSEDRRMDMGGLSDVCLPSTDPSADIPNAVPRWSRLVSDVYTHAYMNSDYSPYSGQQQEFISKNMQASCINKMVTGNRGELGASILTSEQKARLNRLQQLEDNVYKNYESLANKIIKNIGNQMRNTGSLMAGGTRQYLANCFRCAEVGSTVRQRLETNTYIPSFQLPLSLQSKARSMIPSKYGGLITSAGLVQIYVASYTDLAPFFFISHPAGIVYMQAMLKNTLTTKPDPTQFKKRDANGNKDGGVYASTNAKKAFAESLGCPAECLWCESGFKPIIKGARATCITDKCSACTQLFDHYHVANPPAVTSLARAISKKGLGQLPLLDRVAPYPDPDGSPRIGRPPNLINGEKPVPTDAPDTPWELPSGPLPTPPTMAPSPQTTTPPSPPITMLPPITMPPITMPPMTTPPPNADMRRRRRGAARRRRRGSARRRRRGSARRRRRSAGGKSRRRRTDAALQELFGDVEPLPMGDCS